MANWKSRLISLLLLTGAACLVAGVTLPVLRFTRFGFLDSEQSILSTVGSLLGHGEWFLGVVIGLFSVVFPIVKLSVMALIHYGERRGGRALEHVHWLGKWSMLDVFVVVSTLGLVQLGALGETEPLPGIYWYGLSVILAMSAATLLEQVAGAAPSAVSLPAWLALPCLGLLGAGVMLPLMSVEKWLFWEQQFSLLQVLPAMWEEGEKLLPLVLALGVILLPAATLLIEAWPEGRAERWRRRFLGLREWSMLEVFVLGMCLVWFKVSDRAEVTLMSGFWLLAACAAVHQGGLLVRRLQGRGSSHPAGSEEPKA